MVTWEEIKSCTVKSYKLFEKVMFIFHLRINVCISVDLAHTTADDGSEIFLPTLHFLCYRQLW